MYRTKIQKMNQSPVSNTPIAFDKTSNNKYFQCPAMMDDGRIFTDYRPSTYVNDMIRFSNHIQSSYDYRQFLTHNANNIMKVNTMYTHKKVGCDGTNGVYIPNQTVCTVNKTNSRCQDVDPKGMGLTNMVPPGTAQQLGVEGHIMGHQCGREFAQSAPLTPQFDRQMYARF